MKIVVIGSSNMIWLQVSHLLHLAKQSLETSFHAVTGGRATVAGGSNFASELGQWLPLVDMYAIFWKQFEKEGIITDYIVDDECHPRVTSPHLCIDSGEIVLQLLELIILYCQMRWCVLKKSLMSGYDCMEIPYETRKKVALLANEGLESFT